MTRINFTPEMIDVLTDQLDIFKPAGANDNQRVEMTGRPFLAIDPGHASEIDDAIRVSRLRGGSFLVEVAIADGSQLNGQNEVIKQAIDMRSTSYDLPHRVPMLPAKVTSVLNLQGYTSRAIVVSRRYSKDLEPSETVTIQPASIKVDNTTYARFGLHTKQTIQPHKENPLIQFQRMYRQMNGRDYISPRNIENPEIGAKFASKLVATYMVLANLAVANWAAQNQVPILYRNFDPTEYERRDQALGTYSTVSGVHTGIREAKRSDAYTHATSPLRRAVDLVNHLQIGRYLGGSELAYSKTELQELSTHFNTRTNRNREVA
jgi:ribonuclease R